jgi:type VI secretion system protein ImpK
VVFFSPPAAGTRWNLRQTAALGHNQDQADLGGTRDKLCSGSRKVENTMASATVLHAVEVRPRRTWSLALAFQEILTAVIRVRYRGQVVTSVEAFRADLRQALQTAYAESQAHGYSAEDAQRAMFAVVAFIDESVLNSRNPAFADWPRMPLQEEFYGGHVGGELFFRDLQSVMERMDSTATADLLEVYCLCLQLGYRGRYGAGASGELPAILGRVREKLRRIRGDSVALSPGKVLPAEPQPAPRKDPWERRLALVAIVLLAAGALLFGAMKLRLASGVSEIHAIATESRS